MKTMKLTSPKQIRLGLIIAITLLTTIPVIAASFVIYSTFGAAPGTTCGVSRSAYAIYVKTAAQGWGWKLDTNAVTHVASIDTNAVVEYVSSFGRNGCGIGSVTVTSSSPATEKFRFAVYWPTANGPAPSGPYPLTLDGFLP